LKRAIVLRPLLATTGDIEGAYWSVQQPELHPITRVELEHPMISVILKLVMVLCLLEPLVHFEDELIVLDQLMVYHR
jgi:hypothetical protein